MRCPLHTFLQIQIVQMILLLCLVTSFMLKRLQRLVVVFQFSEVDGQILPSGRRAGRAPDLRVADMGRPPWARQPRSYLARPTCLGTGFNSEPCMYMPSVVTCE